MLSTLPRRGKILKPKSLSHTSTLPTTSCGVSSGFKTSKFCLMEVKPQKKFGHLLSQHILWLK